MSGPSRTVTGTVTYRERIMPPRGSTLTVQLVGVSRPASGETTLAEQVIDPLWGVPQHFTLTVGADRIDDAAAYAVSATITLQGRLLWTAQDPVPVLTRGAADEVDLVLTRVALPG